MLRKIFNEKDNLLVEKFKIKFEGCEVLDIDRQSSSKIIFKVKHECGNIRDDVNYRYFMSNKLQGEFPCKCNGRQKVVKSKYYYQDRIDEKFGKDRLTIIGDIDESIPKRKYANIKFTCGHTKKWEINDLLSKKVKPDYDCILCNDRKGTKVTESILVDRIRKSYGNMISYVGNFTTMSKQCDFIFNECGHKFKRTPNNLLFSNNKDTLICPECYTRNRKSYENTKLLSSNLSPIYTPGKYVSSKRGIEIICNECNNITGIIKKTHLENSTFKRNCNCEISNQNDIVKNFIDIYHLGKTKKLNKFINIDNVYEFQFRKNVEFNIHKRLNNELSSLDSENYNNLQLIRELKLPYNKMSIRFNSPLLIPKRRNNANIELYQIIAFNVDIFNVENVIEVIFKSNSKSDERRSIYMFMLKDRHTPVLSFSRDYDLSNVMKTACNIIEYITNLNDIDKEVIESNGKNVSRNYNNKGVRQTGEVIYKTLYRDSKKKYTYIKNDNSSIRSKSKRTIEACFDVAGHYMHLKKSGKKTFRNGYTKGEQYRHIRRIEKVYKIK